jgi:hypothetical protein
MGRAIDLFDFAQEEAPIRDPFVRSIRLTANEAPRPDGGPAHLAASDRVNANSEAGSAYSTSPAGEQRPVITIHSTDNVTRGKTGSFVLDMKPALMFGGTYVNFSVSGTAVSGVDYASLVSPACIGQSGYGVILVQTLPDPRASSFRQPYSVVVTLEPGLGYAVGDQAQPQCGLSLELESSTGGMARCAVSGSFRGGAALLRCWGTAMVIRSPLESFANNGDENLSTVRSAAMFE